MYVIIWYSYRIGCQILKPADAYVNADISSLTSRMRLLIFNMTSAGIRIRIFFIIFIKHKRLFVWMVFCIDNWLLVNRCKDKALRTRFHRRNIYCTHFTSEELLLIKKSESISYYAQIDVPASHKRTQFYKQNDIMKYIFSTSYQIILSSKQSCATFRSWTSVIFQWKNQ